MAAARYTSELIDVAIQRAVTDRQSRYKFYMITSFSGNDLASIRVDQLGSSGL